MIDREQPGLHCPPWDRLRYAALLGGLVLAWFLLVYGGCNWFTQQHDHRVRLHLDAELTLPLVPAMSLVYLSMNVLLWMAPFVLPSRRQLFALAMALAGTILAAAPFFLLFPAMDAFPTPDAEALSIWALPFGLARAMALEHNFFPSLHIALTVVAAAAYTHGGRSRLARVVWWSWAGAIAVSTILTHQHYLVDVPAGVLLGWLGWRFIYSPLASRSAAANAAAGDPSSIAYRIAAAASDRKAQLGRK